MSNRYLRQYDGYLKEHLGLIESMHRAGADNAAIALRLYEIGVRAHGSIYNKPLEDDRQVPNLGAMVAYICRKHLNRPIALHFWADP